MNAPMKQRWDAAQEDHLLFLRDREKLRFAEIGPRMGRSPQACEVRYYTRLFAVNDARHQNRVCDAVRPAGGARPAAPQIPLPDEHGGFRAVDLNGLRERAELLLRIAERGLTGGVFGDPAPGRSALDQRARAAAAAVGRPFGVGVSDG
ncbi:hypothetical protein ACSHT2_02655 [Bradyrhizobium sp. PUT101]|uniref:hypothetical protein n=1 Tax=Bradyrhizobium sp. PUT101 TaxID=3447427 RepID=UPI003F8513F9